MVFNSEVVNLRRGLGHPEQKPQGSCNAWALELKRTCLAIAPNNYRGPERWTLKIAGKTAEEGAD